MKKIDVKGNRTYEYIYENLSNYFQNDIERIMLLIEETPCPERTFFNLETILTNIGDFKIPRKFYKPLVTIVSFSPFLTKIFKKSPAQYINYIFIENNISKIFNYVDYTRILNKELQNVKNTEEVKRVLRIFKQREFLRIGAQDILKQVSLESIMLQISDLASSFLEAASEWLCENIFKNIKTNDFFILGMGKLGGRELNYSSDIDLIYIFTNREKQFVLKNFFELLTKIINEITENGFVFRVDLRLRPEGSSGAIATEYESALFYYENFGRFWERAAMIKGRAVAGNLEKGKSFLKELEPFIYRRALDFKITEEILLMKEKINQSVSMKNLTNDIKIGKGGIREIEFIIQTIQLIFGGKYGILREKNSLNFLNIIKEKFDFLSMEDVDKLIESYKFLRNLEHKIQMQYEKQTQKLPANKDDLLVIANFFGFKNIDEFMKFQREIREEVHFIFKKFMHHENDVTYGSCDENKDFSYIDENLLKKSISEKVENSEHIIKAIFETSDSVPEENMLLINLIFSSVLKNLDGKREKNDNILLSFSKLLEKLKYNKGYLSFILKNRDVVKVLINIFEKSEYLTEILIKYKDSFEEIFFTDILLLRKDISQYINELQTIITESLTYEDLIEKIRIFKHKEDLRIGLNFLNNNVSITDTVSQLSNLAISILQISIKIVFETVEKKFGKTDSRFAIIALGKFGGMEMNFGSDLDLIFIFEKNLRSDKGFTCQEYFSRFFQRIISFLTMRTINGIVYEIDTRLRPSGNAGALVSSFDSFREYHEKSSEIWERQALLKSKVVAGDKKFGEEVINFIKKSIIEKDVTFEDISEILRIRKRIEMEQGLEDKYTIDIKNGKGGIIDIEFLVQIFLLKNKIVEGNTLRALEKLCAGGIINKNEKNFFTEAYIFLRFLENRIRLMQGKTSDKIYFEKNRDFFIEAVEIKKKVREHFLLYFKDYI